jgi:SAM-dependent methyltransferase
MSNSEFDKYAEQYDQALGEAIPHRFKEDGYFAEYKIALAAKLLGKKNTTSILDFGCGAGRSLPYLAKYFPEAEIWGHDVSAASLKIASERVPSAKLFSDWYTIKGMRFDAIIAANVFHHIPIEQRQSTLFQCRDALATDGFMLIFEHNPYNPLTRMIFERCPFDRDAQMLSLRSARRLAAKVGFQSVRYGYTLFFPRPLASLRPIESFFRRVPIGAQYYVQMAK